MLTDLIMYDLKVAALIAVFYLFYMLLLSRETMHKLNRIVLLSGIVLSAVLPFCVITFHKTVVVESTLTPTTVDADVDTTLPAAEVLEQSFDWTIPLVAILLIGAIVRCLFLIRSYRQLTKMVRGGEMHILPTGTKVCIVDEPVAPFSWMKTIVMSRADWNSETTLSPILTHEEAHVRHRHSYDIMVVELLTALQWFNPVVWFLRQELRILHEYEADADVLSNGFNESQYVHLLMQKAMGIQACVLANGIHTPKTKKRIIMMLKSKSNRHAWLRALYVVPVVLVSLAVSAKTFVHYEYETTPEPEMQASKVDDEPVFEICEEAPRYKDGEGALMQFIAKNIRYPKEATEHGIQGRVIVQFIVNKDGSCSNFKILTNTAHDTSGGPVVTQARKAELDQQQGIETEYTPEEIRGWSKSLETEAIRVLKLAGKWEPGKQRGKAVRAYFVLPVTFRLQ